MSQVESSFLFDRSIIYYFYNIYHINNGFITPAHMYYLALLTPDFQVFSFCFFTKTHYIVYYKYYLI